MYLRVSKLYSLLFLLKHFPGQKGKRKKISCGMGSKKKKMQICWCHGFGYKGKFGRSLRAFT